MSVKKFVVQLEMNGFSVLYFGSFGDGSVVIQRSRGSVVLVRIIVMRIVGSVAGVIVMRGVVCSAVQSGQGLSMSGEVNGFGVFDSGGVGHGTVVVEGSVRSVVSVPVTMVIVLVVIIVVVRMAVSSGLSVSYGSQVNRLSVFDFGRIVDGSVVF